MSSGNRHELIYSIDINLFQYTRMHPLADCYSTLHPPVNCNDILVSTKSNHRKERETPIFNREAVVMLFIYWLTLSLADCAAL